MRTERIKYVSVFGNKRENSIDLLFSRWHRFFVYIPLHACIVLSYTGSNSWTTCRLVGPTSLYSLCIDENIYLLTHAKQIFLNRKLLIFLKHSSDKVTNLWDYHYLCIDVFSWWRFYPTEFCSDSYLDVCQSLTSLYLTNISMLVVALPLFISRVYPIPKP